MFTYSEHMVQDLSLQDKIPRQDQKLDLPMSVALAIWPFI